MECGSPCKRHKTRGLPDCVVRSCIPVFSVIEEHPAGRRLSFGVFDVDLGTGEIRKHGLRIRLQQQPFQVLALLLERPGDVITREQLQQKLWPANTFVDFDHGLNKAINKIRAALGDSAEAPRFVETVARRGYRFLAEVRVAGPAIVPPALPERPSGAPSRSPASAGPAGVARGQPRTWLVAASVILAVLAALGVWELRRAAGASPAIHSIAVLPLESLSSDQSQEYFADGMTDELITDLGQIRALRVISRSSVMAYKRTRKSLLVIARELNVDAVVEGTVLRSGDRVRITAQLIEAATDRHLWADSYQGELRNTLALQNDVARAIADQIRVNVSPHEQAALRSAAAVNPAAYESYLRGRFFWNKRTSNGLSTALAYFTQAVEQDPTYARAYSGLADTYALLGDWQYAVMTPKEALPKAKAAAMQAIALDGSLGEAHTSLAFCLDGFDWNFAKAGTEFERAIELNPGYATAHHWYAWHLALLRQYDEGIAEMRKAQSLDPLSLVINADLAELLALAHRYDESIRQSQRTLELDPGFGLAHNHLGQAYLQTHKTEQAIAELQKAVALSGDGATCMANLARAYVAAGRNADARQLLDDLKTRSSVRHSYASEIAMIDTALGDPDQAMVWLERGEAERFNPGVLLRPGFDSLRSDPRFVALLQRVGLSVH